MKKYIVRLTGEDRKCCEAKIGKLAGSSQQARRARILKQIDADGTNWASSRSRLRLAVMWGRSRLGGAARLAGSHGKGTFYQSFEPSRGRALEASISSPTS